MIAPDVPSAAPPLRIHVALDTPDLDQIREVVGIAQHPVRVALHGGTRAPRFRLHHHPLSRIALTHASLAHTGELRVEAPPIDTHYLLQIPLRGGSSIRHGPHDVTTDPTRRAAFLSPGHSTVLRSSGGFEEVTIEFDAPAIHDAWIVLMGEDAGAVPELSAEVRLDREPGASILRLVRFLVDEISRPASALRTHSVSARLEEALLLAVLETHVQSATLPAVDASPKGSASLVRDAEVWIERWANRPLSVADVARAHGVSIRTLQRSFRVHRGTTPRTFLRLVRLQRVRARLRLGATDTTVTEAAVALGFAHLGRFSADYRARYGESPSTTLRRAQGATRGRRGRSARGADPARRVALDVSNRRVDGDCGLCKRGTSFA